MTGAWAISTACPSSDTATTASIRRDAKLDDLGQLGLVEQDYAWITHRIKDVARRHANKRIVSCLEGGYNLSALGRSVEAHLRVLADV